MSELARIAGPVGCAGLVLLLLATRRDARIAGLLAWALGTVALAAYLAPSGRTAWLVLAAAAGAIASVAGAYVLLRWPWALAFATLACIPIRIPLEIGDEEANLLVPLYLVVSSLALALGWRLIRGEARTRELGSLALPLAAFIGWTGLSLVWTDDLRRGAIFLLAFVLPFGLLALGFARLPWARRPLVWLYGALLATAVAFAGVGLYQWVTRDVFWNPRVIVGNAYAPFYRVNSVFWDPSIYGRYLVVAILASLALVMLGLRGRLLAGAVALVAVLWVGLLVSFSQSSFAALVAGVLVAATVAWRWRAAAALGAVAVVVLSVGFATPQVRTKIFDESRAGLDKATSSRAGLVANGIRIAGDHPLEGVGVGSFQRAYADRTGLAGRDPQKAASHTTPVTVAAETGLPGLALFLWLGVVALGATLLGAHRSDAGRAALVVGLTLGAIAVHSVFYNALFEDPITWALFGLAALTAAQRRGEQG